MDSDSELPVAPDPGILSHHPPQALCQKLAKLHFEIARAREEGPIMRANARQFWGRSTALAGLVVLVAVVSPTILAEAQQAAPLGTPIAPMGTLAAEGMEIRTLEGMQQAEAARGRVFQEVAVPFRPMMSDFEYEQAKAAAKARFGPKPRDASAPSQPLATPPMLIDSVFTEGANQIQAGGSFPPDTHGAAGVGQFVEVTNVNLSIYDTTVVGPPLQIFNVGLDAFFGYFTQPLTDPRVLYDSTWNRWVVLIQALPESPTVQFFLIAASATSDARGPYFSFRINVIQSPNEFWDFPHLGMDQDAIIITSNVFMEASMEARAFAIAKARLYNNLNAVFPVFGGLVGTLAPPVVLDQNGNTFLVAAPPNGTTITKYTMTNSSRPPSTTLVPSTITVPSYSMPPNAVQPGTTAQLDTKDSRFQSASTQIGDSLFQVHTVFLGSFPAPKFYEFNTASNTVTQSGFFFRSDTSYDFNAVIAANASAQAFVTWSATDPPLGINAEVRFSGRQPGDPAGVIPPGSALPAPCTSPTFLAQQDQAGRFRWGDYAAVTLDPLNPSRAWIVNENVLNPGIRPNTWDSCLAQIGF